MRHRLLLALLVVPTACVARDESADSAENALEATLFQEVTSTALPQQGCGPGAALGCYTNYAITADLDGDGHLDLVMANGGNHFVAGPSAPQAIFFGNGTGTFADGNAAFADMAPSLVRQVAVADFDGDGRLDVYMPGGYGNTDDQLFMQHAPRAFANEPTRVGAGRSTAGGVHAGDIDNDGDIDLVIADWGVHPNPPATPVTVRILLNDGTGQFTPGATLASPGGTTASDIDLQDVNGDFALDIVLNNRNGQSRLYTNDGKGTFTDVTESLAFPRKRGPYSFNAELCDVDADGDLDLLFDNAALSVPGGHATQLLINDGSGRFTDETDRIVGESRSDDNQVKCGDVDGDGDFDLVVASLANATEKLFWNDGTGRFQIVPNAFPRLGDPTLSIDFGDFDGDGKIDLLTAQGEVPSRPWIERIFKNTTQNGDKNKPLFRRVEHPRGVAGAPTVLRFAVSDAYTSETGQHVKSVSLAVQDGPTSPEERVVAQFIGGDIYRAVIPARATATALKVTPHAVDRAGNEAAGTTFEVPVEPARER
jgi:hypothetical protein